MKQYQSKKLSDGTEPDPAALMSCVFCGRKMTNKPMSNNALIPYFLGKNRYECCWSCYHLSGMANDSRNTILHHDAWFGLCLRANILSVRIPVIGFHDLGHANPTSIRTTLHYFVNKAENKWSSLSMH